ncbi:MAG: ABC transporter permease, partial [marine benthic group bacterium]|nr:ABC transporter permease [Candidatus Benthicola marisminoris]
PPADASEHQLVYGRTVTSDAHAALGIPEIQGRRFEDTDAEGAEPVVIINESAAETLYPGENPVGRQLAVDLGEEARFKIVGVVGDIVMNGLSSDRPMAMYFPYGQRASSGMRLVVHTRGEPTAVVAQLREILQRLDPDIPLAHVASMEEVIQRSTSFERTIVGAVGLFAAVALFMAALGLYGVLAYHVQQRTHEIGIRVALGARAEHILRMVVGQGFLLVGIGLAIGIAAAFGGARLIRDLLFGIGAADPATFGAVVLFFSLVALIACLLPAWRAWKVDPVVAFRAE